MAPVQQLEELGVGVRHPQEAIRLEVPEDPPALALRGLEALQGVARSHLRMGAEASGRRRRERRLRGHDDGPSCLALVAMTLDHELLVADPDPRPVAQRLATIQAAPVEPGPVARAGVLEQHLAAGDRDSRLPPRDGRVVESHRAAGRAADRHVVDQRHPRAVGQHELQHQDSESVRALALNSKRRSLERTRQTRGADRFRVWHERPSLWTGGGDAGRSSGPMRTRAPHRRSVTRRSAPARDGRDDNVPRRAMRARRPWWWQPRLRAAMALGALGVAAVLARLAAHLETEAMWFHELGQDRVFWTLFVARWLAGSLTGLGTTAVLLVNFWFAERTAPAEGRLPGGRRARKRLRRILLSAQLVVSAGAGLAVSRAVVLADWQHMLLWLHRRDFGVTDPLFHKDVGFFVFSLPLYENVARWLLMTTAIALACAFATHAATGAIRTKPAPDLGDAGGPRSCAGARRAAAGPRRVAAPAQPVRPRAAATGRDGARRRVHGRPRPAGVAAGPRGGHSRGRGDARVCRRAAFVVGAGRRLAMIAVAELVNPAVLPSVVQRFVVEPQTLSRERPYLAHTLALTRRAYGLDRVADLPVPANAAISNGELRANRDVDPEHPAVGHRRAQAGDRPAAGDRLLLRLPEDHGGPLPARRKAGGHDRRRARARPEPAGPLGADLGERPTRLHPRLWSRRGPGRGRRRRRPGQAALRHVGVRSRAAAGRVAGASRLLRRPAAARAAVGHRAVAPREVEKPLAGDSRQPDYHYSGRAGISMSSPVRRALFALRFGDLNLLLSETLGGHPRILLHRDVGERLRNLAPFLHFERRPEVIVVDGRIMFLAHGYTTSDSYPYAARIRALGGTELNYLRASVVATVDAFSGAVTMYPTDTDDPIMGAWQAAFPTLFTPVERMPADVRAHLRYPRELFDAQAQDLGELPHQERRRLLYQGRRVEAAGRRLGADPEARQPAQRPPGGQAPKLRPDYVLARLPGQRGEQFMLTTMFTPYSEENLSGYLTGAVDALGRPSLTQLSLPRSRRVLGPSQVTRQILASPGVSGRLRLLNQETTDLGDRSVNIVEISDPRVVPIGDSFLYVQTIYVSARGSAPRGCAS